MTALARRTLTLGPRERRHAVLRGRLPPGGTAHQPTPCGLPARGGLPFGLLPRRGLPLGGLPPGPLPRRRGLPLNPLPPRPLQRRNLLPLHRLRSHNLRSGLTFRPLSLCPSGSLTLFPLCGLALSLYASSSLPLSGVPFRLLSPLTVFLLPSSGLPLIPPSRLRRHNLEFRLRATGLQPLVFDLLHRSRLGLLRLSLIVSRGLLGPCRRLAACPLRCRLSRSVRLGLFRSLDALLRMLTNGGLLPLGLGARSRYLRLGALPLGVFCGLPRVRGPDEAGVRR
ncbi:hypothetical protein, partial [Spongiactinospora gelatinilytica]|uniref:hypothetical protein n=1 Tax=Spongiactinospora gelatinilytica TaxID=2666298 RepID=UPI0011B946E5